MLRRHPRFNRSAPLLPYTTLFRSCPAVVPRLFQTGDVRAWVALVEGEEMRDQLPGGGGESAVEQACRARGLHCAGPVALRFGERQEVELERRLDQPGG